MKSKTYLTGKITHITNINIIGIYIEWQIYGDLIRFFVSILLLFDTLLFVPLNLHLVERDLVDFDLFITPVYLVVELVGFLLLYLLAWQFVLLILLVAVY